MGCSQLTKQHRYEMIPTLEISRILIGPVLVDRLLEFMTRKKLEQLTE